MNTTLDVDGLSAGYGRIRVVSDVSFRVQPGEVVAIVGRNGAGKTTSLLAVAGLRYGPCGGAVTVAGVDVTGSSTVRVVRSGLSLVREGRRIFRDMTVLENVRLGAFTRRKAKDLGTDLDYVYELFPTLRTYSARRAGELSGGQQQMVAIGQALMNRPKFLLLDEPASGLAPAVVEEMYDRLRLLADNGMGVAIVDQSVERILRWSDRFYVFESGRTALSGDSRTAAIESINEIILGVTRLDGAGPPPNGRLSDSGHQHEELSHAGQPKGSDAEQGHNSGRPSS
jgi:branched-chain amino acid transport system ATP-binding protein